MNLSYVKVASIVEGERFRTEYGDLSNLIESFNKEGIISPIAVKDQGDGTYLLLAGGRRYRAAKEGNFEEIPCNIYPPTLSDLELRLIELMENVERKDLTWLEQANLRKEIHRLHIEIHGEKKSTSPDAPGWHIGKTAELFGVDRTSISKDLHLADAAERFNEIKTAKTAQEANKMLSRISEEMIREEIAKRIETKAASTPIEVQKHELINRYIIKDVFDFLKTVPDKSMDIVEIDPPYGINLNDIKTGITSNAYKKDTYQEVPVEEYTSFMTTLLSETYRVMSENSWLILWFAPEPWFETLFQICMRLGFKGNRIFAYWHKEGLVTGQTLQPNLYLSTVGEPFFYLRKGFPVISKQGRGNNFVFKPIHSSKKVHPTERPIELMQEILTTFGWANARVLVPFLGSGNTLLAASNLGLQAVGTDLVQAYKDSFIIKVNNSNPGAYCSYAKD